MPDRDYEMELKILMDLVAMHERKLEYLKVQLDSVVNDYALALRTLAATMGLQMDVTEAGAIEWKRFEREEDDAPKHPSN